MIAAILTRLHRAKRIPRVSIDLDVFSPDHKRAVKLTFGDAK